MQIVAAFSRSDTARRSLNERRLLSRGRGRAGRVLTPRNGGRLWPTCATINHECPCCSATGPCPLGVLSQSGREARGLVRACTKLLRKRVARTRCSLVDSFHIPSIFGSHYEQLCKAAVRSEQCPQGAHGRFSACYSVPQCLQVAFYLAAPVRHHRDS